VFFASHVLSEVEALCDRVAILRDGRVVVNDTVEALRARAPRQVTIAFTTPEAAGVQPPPALKVEERSGTMWRGELVGDAPALVRWAAGQPIVDLTVHPPDLGRLFQRAYLDDGRRGPADADRTMSS
jgi:ABC-2 type transport system ATP-binding protein